MSSSLPSQSNTTLPGTSSEEFKSHIQLQASDLDLVSLSPQTPVRSSVLSTIAFRPDRSDTYRQSSALRI